MATNSPFSTGKSTPSNARTSVSPELGMDYGTKHSKRKGLCNIVIRSGFQPGDNVHFHIVGSQKNHRSLTGFSNLPQKLQATAVGKVYIQNKKIKPTLRQYQPCLCQCNAERNLHIRTLQSQLNAASQRSIIFQQQYFLHNTPTFVFGFECQFRWLFLFHHPHYTIHVWYYQKKNLCQNNTENIDRYSRQRFLPVFSSKCFAGFG